jgi:hypothetical protein
LRLWKWDGDEEMERWVRGGGEEGGGEFDENGVRQRCFAV